MLSMANVLIAAAVPLFGTNNSISGQFGWAHGFGNGNYNIGTAIGLDSKGDVLSTGRFSGTVDLDPGVAERFVTSQYTGLFFAKFEGATGELVWGSGIDAHADVSALTVDKSDNLIVCGYYYGTADLAPGTTNMTRTTAGGDDVFVLKLSESGQVIWLKTMGGLEDERPTAVVSDSQGNVYVTGYFSGIVDFDPGPGTYDLEASGYPNTFIVKLTSSGTFLWARQTEGYYPVHPKAIAIDESSVYVAGAFSSLNDFAPGIAEHTLLSNGHNDGFLLQLTNSGDFVSAWQIGGPENDSIDSVAIGKEGALYIGGTFRSLADLRPFTPTHQLSSNGGSDVFIISCLTDGTLRWVDSFGGAQDDAISTLTLGGTDDIYVTGTFKGAVDFTSGAGFAVRQSMGSNDIFVCKFGSSGEYGWSRQIGDEYSDIPSSIAVDDASAVFLSGSFSSWSMDVDPTQGIALLHSNSFSQDMFILRMEADLEGPNAVRITPSTTGPVNHQNISFSVEFDEDVVNFDADDVLITHSGTSHEDVIVQPGSRIYNIKITGISGHGSFSVSVDINGDVVDLHGNALLTSVTSDLIVIDSALPGLPATSHPVCLLLFLLPIFFYSQKKFVRN